MKRGRKRSILSEAELDQAWPMPSAVMIASLPQEDADLYEGRRKAIDLYRAGVTYAAIEKRCRLSRQEVVRLLKRCKERAKDGRIFGYRALVPHTRVAPNERRKPLEPGGGRAGAWQLLMKTYPGVADYIKEVVYAPVEREGAEPLNMGELWGIVRLLLQAEGLTDQDYPFDCGSQGEMALRDHVNALQLARMDHTVAKRHGADAGFRWKHVRAEAERTFVPLRPLSYLILDYYKVDARTIVVVTNEYGETFEIVVPRFHIGVLVDERDGGILGVCAVLEMTPSTDSALETVDCMRNPMRYIKADLRDIAFDDERIFIQQLVPEQTPLSFIVLRVDNAWANAADAFIRGVCYSYGAVVHFGPAYCWVSRAIGERVIGELARNGAQTAKSNTGSSADSGLHGDAAEQAVRYRVTIESLMALILEAAQLHNRGRTQRLRGSSPVTTLTKAHEAAAAGGPLVGIPLPRPTQQDCRFLDFEFVETIHGSPEKGVRPYIPFRGRKFRNRMLDELSHLIGKDARCRIHRFDGDEMHAELDDGSVEFGRLRPDRREGRGFTLQQETLLRKAERVAKKRDFKITRRMKNEVQRYRNKKHQDAPGGKDALLAAKQDLSERRHGDGSASPPIISPSAEAMSPSPIGSLHHPRALPPVETEPSLVERDRFGLFSIKQKVRTR